MARPLSPAARDLRRRLLVTGALLAALLALLIATCTREPRREEVRVFVAVSLADVADALAREFEAEYPGVDVVLTTGASAELARRIEGGEPADVLLSASPAWTDSLLRRGLLRPPVRDLFADHLVVVGRAEAPRFDVLPDLGRVRRLALADPERVAAGAYARAGLERAGLWDALAPRVVPVPDTRAAIAAVRAGEADAAVVYASDTLAARGLRLLLEWPAAFEPPIRYTVGVPRSAPHTDRALEFAEFARQPERAALWRRFGYRPLGEPVQP